jgi:uncharacterized OsmC-like protein
MPVTATSGEGLTAPIQPGTHGLAALSVCAAMTLLLYARRKGWPLAGVTVHLQHERRWRCR